MNTTFYLRQGADDGIARAQYLLGKLHLMGEGISKDTDAAYQWFTTAYYGGHTYEGMFMDRIDRGEQRPLSVILATTLLFHHIGNIFRDNVLPPAFKLIVSGCKSSNASASPSVTSRRIMSWNSRDIRCSSIDSLNAKGCTMCVYFALLKTNRTFPKTHRCNQRRYPKKNNFLRGIVVCVLAAKRRWRNAGLHEISAKTLDRQEPLNPFGLKKMSQNLSRCLLTLKEST